MFKQKTVFIVGAGASYEYGMPVGDTLKNIIAGKLNIRFVPNEGLLSGDKTIAYAIEQLGKDLPHGNIKPLLKAGRDVSAAMPNAISIDNFLHYHSDNPDIVTVGKLAIAVSILEAERKSKLYNGTSGDLMDFSRNVEGWLNPFCKILSEGVQKADLEHIFDNVSIITFNYDRCIEHYIPQWLENYTGISTQDSWELASRLKIIHPYGQVGGLSWQKRAIKTPFGDELWDPRLIGISKQIRTFTERIEEEDVLAEMQKEISEATRIVYLGFSYAEMNMRLLTLEGDGAPKTVYGTAYGISEPNLEVIRGDVFASLTVPRGRLVNAMHLNRNLTCYKLLTDYARHFTS